MFKFYLKSSFVTLQSPEKIFIENLFKNADQGKSIHFVNAFCLVSASRNRDHSYSLSEGICFCDSRPLSWYSGLMRNKVRQMRGVDFLIFGLKNYADYRHLVIGGDGITSSTLRKNIYILTGADVDIQVQNPPYSDDFRLILNDCREAILKHGPDYVWLAVGTPKQDIIGTILAKEFPVNFYCVGAAVNFLSGTVRQAPQLISFVGMEWLFRLFQEPKRLWRRYLIGNFLFLILVTKDGIKRVFRKFHW